jgi:hypothetical protein
LSFTKVRFFRRTVIVNRTRDQFLSGSGLAEQQHRGITRARLFGPVPAPACSAGLSPTI